MLADVDAASVLTAAKAGTDFGYAMLLPLVVLEVHEVERRGGSNRQVEAVWPVEQFGPGPGRRERDDDSSRSSRPRSSRWWPRIWSTS
jgi:hypothetical protein